ncbi:hypothetical protein B7Y94_05395 [Candidatus Saccharibacteria bacterium 32-49-12]|nr:MAG: hypothetical protein B7Y94_05395 [Candidatus Saccharibacteria bacterium 32-49-12]
MKQQVVNLFLYRWRYPIGYGILILVFLIAATTASLYAPGGLTQTEINNLAYTQSIADGTLPVSNIPLHLLQLASVSLLGVSIFSIKLPAVVISAVAAIALFLLLKRWFKTNVALLTMLIMTASGQFIFLAQNATSHILFAAYSALILLFASLILQKAKGQLIWKIGLAVSVGLSLYTPYFVYINLGLLAVALIHPYPRHHLFKKSQRKNWTIAALVLLAVISPLLYLCFQNPELISILLGVYAASFDIPGNLKLLLQSYFWVEPIVANSRILPLLDFSAAAIIILGFIVLFSDRYRARTYMIVAWLLLTLPILFLQPNLTTIALVPVFILLAMGLERLLREWYKLFPKNPYARAVGLVLIVGLIGAMVFSGIDRYTHGYRHLPEAAYQFNSDLRLLKRELRARPAKTHLIVTDDEKPLYDMLSRFDKFDLSVGTSPRRSDFDTANVIVTKQANSSVPAKGWTLQRIVTNDNFMTGDRLYLYKVD